LSAVPETIAELGSITDGENPEHLAVLERVLPGMNPKDCGSAEFRALLGVLERSPLSDGFESYWSIVHFLESCEGYESFLVESVSRAPAELTLTMISRLMNAGFTHCGDTTYISVLESVVERAAIAPELRETASRLLSSQQVRRRDA
jgi:hypothetical protein